MISIINRPLIGIENIYSYEVKPIWLQSVNILLFVFWAPSQAKLQLQHRIAIPVNTGMMQARGLQSIVYSMLQTQELINNIALCPYMQ